MALEFFQRFGTALMLLLATAALGASPAGNDSKSSHTETTTYLKVTYKVFITETGAPEKFEFVAVEPSVSADIQEAFKKSISKAISTWTFNPNKENGKPVPGWVLVPVMIDLADPIPVGGT